MPIINPNFKQSKETYLIKCLIAFFAIFLVLMSLRWISNNIILGAIGASSLASSIFISFALPKSPAAESRRMIGSYVVGISLGVLFYYLGHEMRHFLPHLSSSMIYEITGALAVVLTMFIMIFFSLEHPPAVGMALGIVIDPWHDKTLIFILVTIIIITITKTLLEPWLLSNSPD